MPGPLASANVGADTLGAVAEPTVALRELRREIRAAEAELTALAAKGDKVSAQQTRNLNEMRKKEDALVKIQKQQRDQLTRGRRALDIGEMTKAMLGAGSIKKILAGQADARDIAAFAFMAERQIVKGVKEVAGVRMARMTRGVLKAIPFVGEAIGSLMEGWTAKQDLEKSMAHIGTTMKVGKISKAEEMYAQHVLTETFDDPQGALVALQGVGNQIANIPPEKLSRVLGGFKWFDKTARAADKDAPNQTFGIQSMREMTFNVGEFQSELAKNRAQAEGRIGGALDKHQWKEVVTSTLADLARNKNIKEDVLKELAKQLLEQEPMTIEQTHRRKFEEANRRAIERIEDRGRFIPARLEY